MYDSILQKEIRYNGNEVLNQLNRCPSVYDGWVHEVGRKMTTFEFPVLLLSKVK